MTSKQDLTIVTKGSSERATTLSPTLFREPQSKSKKTGHKRHASSGRLLGKSSKKSSRIDQNELAEWQAQLKGLWNKPEQLKMKFAETPRARATSSPRGSPRTKTSQFTFDTPLDRSADDAIALDISRMGLEKKETLNKTELSFFLDDLRKCTAP